MCVIKDTHNKKHERQGFTHVFICDKCLITLNDSKGNGTMRNEVIAYLLAFGVRVDTYVEEDIAIYSITRSSLPAAHIALQIKDRAARRDEWQDYCEHDWPHLQPRSHTMATVL